MRAFPCLPLYPAHVQARSSGSASRLQPTGVHLCPAISTAFTQMQVSSISYLNQCSIFSTGLTAKLIHSSCSSQKISLFSLSLEFFLSVLVGISRLASPVPNLGCLRQKENTRNSLLYCFSGSQIPSQFVFFFPAFLCLFICNGQGCKLNLAGRRGKSVSTTSGLDMESPECHLET